MSQEKATQQYEMMVILKPDLTAKATKTALDNVRKHIADHKGEIFHEDLWEKKEFAYLVKKYEEGYYAILYFTMDDSQTKALESELALEQSILRKLLLKLPREFDLKKFMKEEKERADIEEKERAEEEKKKEAEGKKRSSSKKDEKTESKPKAKKAPAAEADAESKSEKKKKSLDELDKMLDDLNSI